MLGFIKNLIGGNTAQITEMLQAGATIIDVRSPQEFKAGHADGAMNIPLPTLANQMKKLQGVKAPIITCCASGARSGSAARQLQAAGLEAANGGPWTAVQRALDEVK